MSYLPSKMVERVETLCMYVGRVCMYVYMLERVVMLVYVDDDAVYLFVCSLTD